MKNYTLIEHTADIGMIVRGQNLKRLFQNAAVAMFDIIAKKPFFSFKRPEPHRMRVALSADNPETLLVAWLSELLSLSTTSNIIFYDFFISRLDEKDIEAEVTGTDSAFFRLKTEIKAATYCDLKIEKIARGWQARVIFDV